VKDAPPPVCLDNQAEQVSRTAFRVTLDVEIDPDRASGQFWSAEYVHLLVPDGQRLPRRVVGLLLLPLSLAPLPRPEGVGQLQYREDAPPFVSFRISFSPTLRRRLRFVFGGCLRVASGGGITDLTVAVEASGRGGVPTPGAP